MLTIGAGGRGPWTPDPLSHSSAPGIKEVRRFSQAEMGSNTAARTQETRIELEMANCVLLT